MYKVLIVDDEAPARALLNIKVDWASINCQVVGEAKNGQEALVKYQELQPDLIVTDIQMPVLNGIDMIAEIRKKDKEQAIIILSCHESFAYARQMIRLGVQGYLIKDAFNTEELYSIITDLFDERMAIHQTIATEVQSSIDYSKSLITHQLIIDAMSSERRQGLIKEYQLNLNSPQMALLLVDIELIGQDVTKPQGHQLSATDIQLIQNLMRSALTSFGGGEVCYDQASKFLAINNVAGYHSQLECRKETIALANHMRHTILEHFKVQVTVGISNTFTTVDRLINAYKEALHAANRKIINGYDKTYISTNASAEEEDHYVNILNAKIGRIGSYLNEEDFTPITKEINDIFLQNLKGFMQYNYLKHTNWTLLGMLIDYCSSKGIPYAEIFGSRSPWESIMDIKTVDGMCTWFKKSINNLEALIRKAAPITYSYHVNKCIKYVDEHYSETISLQELADSLDINNAYLSRIFKKETGISLSDYINQVRIETAKELIEHTNKKMYEIAELSGYNSTQRFFQAFKKIVGKAPGDYRKS